MKRYSLGSSRGHAILPALPVPILDLIIALAVTAAASGVQATAGVGFAMISVPILSLLDERLAPVPQILIALPMVIWMAWRERTDIDLRGVRWVIVGRIVGAGIGLWLIKWASDDALELAIGIAVLAGVLILSTGVHIRRTAATQSLAGTAASVSSLVASMGGPPLALLYSDAAAATIRSSLAAVFTFGVTLTVVVRAVSGEISRTDLEVALWLLPALIAGQVGGAWLTGRINNKVIRPILLVLSGSAAAGLIVRAALG